MEFFIPGLSIFLFAIVCTIILSPKATPMVAAILSLTFLTYGIYDHYKMFRSEYRLSTWQQTFKIYSPYIMITAIILYAIFGMVSFFAGVAVPVPSVTLPAMPTLENAGKGITNSLNTAVNSLSNSANDLMGNAFNNSYLNNLGNSLSNNLGFNNNKRNNNLSRSALETL